MGTIAIWRGVCSTCSVKGVSGEVVAGAGGRGGIFGLGVLRSCAREDLLIARRSFFQFVRVS